MHTIFDLFISWLGKNDLYVIRQTKDLYEPFLPNTALVFYA